MHLTDDTRVGLQVTDAFMVLEFEFIRSHGISGIRRLSPTLWEADTLPPPHPLLGRGSNAVYVCQPDTLTILPFRL